MSNVLAFYVFRILRESSAHALRRLIRTQSCSSELKVCHREHFWPLLRIASEYQPANVTIKLITIYNVRILTVLFGGVASFIYI